MRDRTLHFWALATFAVLAFALSGCATHRTQTGAVAIPAAPAPAPILAGHHERERIQWKAVEAIDAVVTGNAVETPVKVETAKIVAANKAASADQLDTLAAAFAATITAQAAEIERQAAAAKAQAGHVGDLTAKIEALKNAELKTQARTLRLAGLGCLAAAGLLAYARQILYAAALGLIGLLCLGLAQLISQPWFMPAVGIATALGLIGLAVAAWRAYQRGTLAKDAEAERDRLRATLGALVPAIDGAMGDLTDTSRLVLKNALSTVMDREHKAVVHEIRAATKAA
jgi:hypothetical protein